MKSNLFMRVVPALRADRSWSNSPKVNCVNLNKIASGDFIPFSPAEGGRPLFALSAKPRPLLTLIFALIIKLCGYNQFSAFLNRLQVSS